LVAKRFRDLGFRLACIDALLGMGSLKRELARTLAIPERDDDPPDVNPSRLKAFKQLPLTQSQLDKIKHLAPDGGDAIYRYVMETWGGTQHELYVKSFQDVKLLTNLELLWVHAVVEQHALDLTLLKANRKLKEVNTDYFFLSPEIDIEKAVNDLKSRGVSIRISGKP
jgi:hypothetical protein